MSAVSHASTVPIRSSQLQVMNRIPPVSGGNLLERLMHEQRTPTAVERFARVHDAGEVPALARTYRDLIPSARPGTGQQYAFEVDLDACTGCKACVAACHSLNGLDENEIWRTVGLLHGGTHDSPAQQTVTTSCHHCVDPACMNGCPVSAYEKDPVTGIVRHLDDQCIGCQYCTLMCPYDAPKYSPARGIVRKCDMCSDRLAVGEAPACVQACPSSAIKIRVVDQQTAVEASEAGAFLPGAPAPDHTMPTTVYKTKRGLPANMLPADFFSLRPEHSHPALVVMLVLTQLAVGTFVLGIVTRLALGSRLVASASGHAILALALAALALGASTAHLGRPHLAWRAFLGVRTSWLSREILSFGLFAKLAAIFALGAGFGHRLPAAITGVLEPMLPALELGAATVGLVAVLCSVMVYAATQRSHWRASYTGARFLGTTILLGSATLLLAGSVNARAAGQGWNDGVARVLIIIVAACAAAKLIGELAVLRHLRSRRHTVGKRVALLFIGDLHTAALFRGLGLVVGGLVVPLLWLIDGARISVPFAGAVLGPLVVGELLERYLFFKAAPSSRMPGSLP